MKALYITEPGKTEFREISKPERKKGEALLRPLYIGICGSDLGSYRGTFAYFEYPRIPGHEFSAEIVEIDDNPYGYRPGMIVTANPYFNCGSCYSCRRGFVNACMDNQTMGCQRDGAFAEYITMPVERLIPSGGLDPKILALIEPFCIGYHGIKRARVKEGDKVLIVGGGTIGVMAGLSAKLRGADVYISDVLEEKLRYDEESFGFKAILNDSPDAIAKATEEITGISIVNGKRLVNGFDVTVEAVGLPSTFQTCIDAVAFGGSVALVGVSKKPLDFAFNIIQKKELNIYGSRNAETSDFKELIELVRTSGIPLEKVITSEYACEDAGAAFHDFSTHGEKMLKTVIKL